MTPLLMIARTPMVMQEKKQRTCSRSEDTLSLEYDLLFIPIIESAPADAAREIMIPVANKEIINNGIIDTEETLELIET